MSSIKTNFELPRGDDPVKQAQRLSQDLSSNFKGVVSLIAAANKSTQELQNQVDSLPTSAIGFTKGAFFNCSSLNNAAVTITHGLGVTPLGWFVCDVVNGGANTIGLMTRYSWSTTTLVINPNSTAGTINFTVYVVA